MLAELAGAGEALVAGRADMALAAIAARAAGGGRGQGRRAGAPRASRCAVGPLGRQRGHSAGELDGTKDVLDAPARAAASDVLQLRGELGGGRRYERLLRGGRALPARLLRELGAVLRAFARVRWRTGHLALIFDALALYPRWFITRRSSLGSAVALARRDGRKHFCHIDGLEALFRIRVTWFWLRFGNSSLVATGTLFALVSLGIKLAQKKKE